MPTRKTARKQIHRTSLHGTNGQPGLADIVTSKDEDELLILSSDDEDEKPAVVDEEDEWCIMDTI